MAYNSHIPIVKCQLQIEGHESQSLVVIQQAHLRRIIGALGFCCFDSFPFPSVVIAMQVLDLGIVVLATGMGFLFLMTSTTTVIASVTYCDSADVSRTLNAV